MEYLSEIVSFILGGALGSLLTFQFSKKSANNGGVVTDQSSAKAGGDVVGRDKINTEK